MRTGPEVPTVLCSMPFFCVILSIIFLTVYTFLFTRRLVRLNRRRISMVSRSKISSFVLFIALLLTASAHAQEPAQLSVDNSIHYISGSQTFIPIRLISAGGERSVSFSIGWDIATGLRYVRTDLASGSPSDAVVTVNSSKSAAGRVGITITTATGFAPGSKVIARIVTQSVEPEVLPLRVDYLSNPTTIRVTGADGNAIPASGTGLTFSVRSVADPGSVLSLGQLQPGREKRVDFPVHFDSAFFGFEGIANVSFSLRWEPDHLDYRSVSVGNVLPPGTTVSFNETMVNSGLLGVTVEGTSPFIDTIRYNLANVRLQLRETAPINFYPISFTDKPTPYRGSNASGQPMWPAWWAGYVNNGVNYSTVRGMVFTPDFLRLRNATVLLTDDTGFSRTATTSSFGDFIFRDVPNISNYTINVRSKRYRFAPVPIVPTGGDNAPLIQIRGLE